MEKSNKAVIVISAITLVVSLFFFFNTAHKSLGAYNRGAAYAKNGNYDEAIAEFNKCIELSPFLDEAYIARGGCYAKKGNFEQALTDYNKAIEKNHRSLAAYNNRGWLVYYKTGDLGQAIADYTKAIEIDPKQWSAYYNRGLAYYCNEQYDKALADYTVAINLKPAKVNYDEFIKDAPSKSSSDTNDTREQILQLFKEKLDSTPH